jgi:acyl-CoA reductase-like NAD-dependent aldehyde dehydrogenase
MLGEGNVAVTEAPLEVLPGTGLLIGDTRVDSSSGGEWEHIYPATGKLTTRLPLAGADEIDAAVLAARAAFPSWKALPADQRRNLLLKVAALITEHATELSTLQSLENGMPQLIAGSFPPTTADLFTYNAGWADKIGGDVISTWGSAAFDYTIEEPYGVVAIIIPWNGPMVSVGQTAGPALAAGNTVVLKPPELAPFTCLRLGELFLEAGFPPGVVNVVPAGPVGGEALVRHRQVDKIHFTGSGETARKILANTLENLTPVGLELGGKSANLVFADADLDQAVQQALGGIVNLSGQGCINGTRVLIESSVYDEFVSACVGMIGAIPMGDPFGEMTFMGPVISAGACERILGMIERAKGESTLVAGGERLGGDLADGYFIAPTIFADVDNSGYIAQHEVFGPVLAIEKFETEEEAVALANDTPYGLAAYVHTNDLRRTHRVASALECGNLWVNGFMGIPASVPFGGVKQSGNGRIGGKAGIHEFLRPKNVWVGM